MSVERIKKPWRSSPPARIARVRPLLGFYLQPLENRIALSSTAQAAPAQVLVLRSDDPGSPAAVVRDKIAHGDSASTGSELGDQPSVADVANPPLAAKDKPAGATIGVTSTAAPDTSLPDDANNDPPILAQPQVGPFTSTAPDSEASVDNSSDGNDSPALEPAPVDQSLIPTPAGRNAQTYVAVDDLISGLLDPLAWTQSQNDLLEAAADEASIDDPLPAVVGLLTSGLSTRKDLVDEIGIGGRVDIMSASGWRAFSLDSSAFRRDLVQALDDAHSFETQHESIMAGTMPLRTLLNALELADQNDSGERGRVAELSPVKRSASLAMVATLWTVRPDVRYSPDPGDGTSGPAIGSLESAKQVSSWKTYVMGLDRAFERTCRNICETLAVEPGSPAGEPTRREPADRIDWRGPIVPSNRADWIENGQGAARGRGPIQSGRDMPPPEAELLEPAPAAGDTGSPTATSRDPDPVALARRAPPAVLPALSIFASGALAAGWLWARRLNWARRRTAETSDAKAQAAGPITPTD